MPTSQPRTFFLRERTPRRCRLSSLDLGLLLSRYPGRFDVVATNRKGVWRLTPRGCAGVVVTPTARLVIEPKIPLDNLFYLVDPTAPVVAVADHSAAVEGEAVFAFLAGQFATRLARRVATGLQRGYQERIGHGAVLQGRIDVAAHLREGPTRLDELHYRYDDFTPDIPCNRALKAITETVLLSPLLTCEARRLLRQALTAFEQVQAELHDGIWNAGERLPAEDALLLDLGHLLLDGLAPGPAAGPTPSPGFLLDTERVWERYITRVVCAGLAGIEGTTVAVQREVVTARDADGRPLLLRPDIVIEQDGTAPVVIDAKWKSPGRSGPAPEDLHQVTAYATALAARRAVLGYPGRRDVVRSYTFERAPLEVEVRKVRVRGTRQELAESAREWVEELRCLSGRRGC
jgi:5-methylcytosine-specific restriction enzyme subunit McrC